MSCSFPIPNHLFKPTHVRPSVEPTHPHLLLGLLQQPVDERLIDNLVRVFVRVPV